MKKLFIALIIACLFYADKLKAQMNQTDIKGVIVKETASDIEGNPYLFDDWQTGTIASTNGKKYIGVKLKYDIQYNQLVFLTGQNEPMIFADPVESFTISNLTFKKGFPPVEGQTGNSFYEVLADGAAKLLKLSTKVISEHATYGSQTVEKSYRESQHYYIEKNGQMIRIKPDKKSVLLALPDHPVELEAYINVHHVNFKDDTVMGQMMDYYNALK